MLRLLLTTLYLKPCVVSAYALVPDVTRKLTPDVKRAGESRFVHVEISSGRRRVGGSALAQVLSQLGRKTPDLDDPMTLASAFRVLQRWRHQLIERW